MRVKPSENMPHHLRLVLKEPTVAGAADYEQFNIFGIGILQPFSAGDGRHLILCSVDEEHRYPTAPDRLDTARALFKSRPRLNRTDRNDGSTNGQEIIFAVCSETTGPITHERVGVVDVASPGAFGCHSIQQRVQEQALDQGRAAARVLRAVPEGGAGLVAVEGPGELSGHGVGQTEAQRAKPALPGARMPDRWRH